MINPEIIKIDKEKKEEEASGLQDLVTSLEEHMEKTDFDLKKADEPEKALEKGVQEEIDTLVEATEKGKERPLSKEGPFSEKHLWDIAQQLEKGEETIGLIKGKGGVIPFSREKEVDGSKMSEEVIEHLYDEQGRVDYKKYFETEEGQVDLKYLSQKTKEFFNTKERDKKSKIFEDIEGVRKQLASETGGIVTIEPNGDVFIEVDGKKERVFDDSVVDIEDLIREDEEKKKKEELKRKEEPSIIDLRRVENCEVAYLEAFKDKEGVVDFTGLKAEGLTSEKIKLLKSFKAVCFFSDEVKKKIDSF